MDGWQLVRNGKVDPPEVVEMLRRIEALEVERRDLYAGAATTFGGRSVGHRLRAIEAKLESLWAEVRRARSEAEFPRTKGSAVE